MRKKNTTPSSSVLLREFTLVASLAIVSLVAAQSRVDDPESSVGADTGEVFELSPFKVNTDNDRGYLATNAISGTRLNSDILSMPLPLEIITEDFIRDTGALDLRDTLRYSAGIQLESQNDYLGNGNRQYDNVGGVNNPSGETADKSDTAVVIRGFTTNNSLRDGFRRKVSTDAANLSRVEVVRGPAALLYGVGNFGGVVNYLVKQPSPDRFAWIDLTVGSYGMIRGTLDYNLPLADDSILGEVNFRLNAAAQHNENHTDFYEEERFSIAPILTFQPTKRTQFTFDFEYGESESQGIGFQSLRGRADITNLSTGQGGLEHAGFLTFPEMDLRTMRWSGPETFLKSKQGNLLLKLTHRIAENLDLLAGYNHSWVDFEIRDVTASLTNNIGPISLWSTVTPVPLDAGRGDTDADWTSSPVDRAIVAYTWNDTEEEVVADQFRVELSYKLDLFGERKWTSMRNHFLAGISGEKDESTETLSGLDSAAGIVNYKSAADSTPFSFATQGDGSPSLPMKKRHYSSVTAKETGAYLVYQGHFLDDHVTLLGGLRRDKNTVETSDIGYNYTDGSIDPGSTSDFDSGSDYQTTKQYGVSVAPIESLSFFALYSEGLTPNFSGHRDLSGAPMKAVKAENEEFGLKFSLFDGRLSGTISHYRITRSGQPNTQFWWAPQTAVQRFDPSKPTVFNVTDMNPDAALVHQVRDNDGNLAPLIQWNNNYAWYGDLNAYAEVPAGAQGNTANAEGLEAYRDDGLNALRSEIQDTWAQAKAVGAVNYWNAEGAPIDESTFATLAIDGGASAAYTTLNASTPEGASYMDAVFDYTRKAGIAHPGSDNWPGGFFWNPAPDSTGYNIATLDGNSWANTDGNLAAPQKDRNTGWDGQIIVTPTDQWQILFSFHKNNHEILSLGEFPEYPNYDKDRWTPWLFPNGQWGLSGHYGENEQYTDESDSSTFSFKGMIVPGAQAMDYPKWSWSLFSNYHFKKDSLFEGLTLGGGVVRTGPAEYASGYTHSGDQLKDNEGVPLVLYTDARWTVNVFGRYEFTIAKEHHAFVQINVDNLFNDEDQYGYLYAPGRYVYLKSGLRF